MFISDFPFFRQLDQMDCGPACLKMICSYFGKDHSIQFLREKCGITKEGVSILGICDAAEEIGLKSFAIDVNFESLSQEITPPCIVHWRQRHFLIVYKISSQYVWVADPGFGKVKYTKEEFMDGWLYNKKVNKEDENLGYIVLLEPMAEFYDLQESKSIKKFNLSFLLPYLDKYKLQIIQIIFGLLIYSLLQVTIPYLTQLLVDKGIKLSKVSFIYLILFGQLMIFLSQTILEINRRWLILFISRNINISIISDFLSKMMRLPLSFFDSKMVADLIQRIDDQKQIDTFLSNTSLSMLFSLVNVFIFGGVLLFYNNQLFFIFLIGCVIYFTWVFLFVKRRSMLSYLRRDQSAENRSSVLQIIHGIHEIKLNNSEKKRRWEWESIQAKVFDTSIKELRLEQFQVVGGNFIMQITYLIITSTAALSVINGSLTLGMMLASQYIIGQLSIPINNFVSFIQGAKEAEISIERLGEIFALEEENRKSTNQLTNESITLKSVSFRYGQKSSNLVLNNVDFVIPKGKITAIVGTSGSGKTTLMKLLLKFYPVTDGEILIGNNSITDFDDNYWRSKCGVVMQDGFIFADTILRNITESDEGYMIDKKRLKNAIEIANIEEMINNLPLGFNTNLSWGGINLSGGESQRVLIARAVYKNPELLFFDEATSSLDAHNEKVIMQNLNSFFQGRTVLIIAHRLSTVKNADNIIVLSKGEIAEQGTHENLVDKKGIYFKLVKNQLELGA